MTSIFGVYWNLFYSVEAAFYIFASNQTRIMSSNDTKAVEFNCDLCSQPDTADMVMCDDCSVWTHFSCAKVSEAIKDHPFSCKACTNKKVAKEKADKLLKEKKAKEKAERLLKEKNEKIAKAEAEAALKIKQKSNAHGSTKLSEKQQATTSNATSATGAERADLESTTPSSSSQKKKKGLKLLAILEEKRKAAEERDRLYYEEKLKIVQEMETESSSSEDDIDNDDNINVKEDNVRKTQFLEKWTSKQSNAPLDERVNNNESSRNQNERSRRTFSYLNSRSQREFINSTTLDSSRRPSETVNFEDSVRRIAAKHIYDLPTFSGCPSDWPMFLTTYVRSTEALNLSNHDNMFRLQRSLKGDALNLVKSYLIYEESVPKAVNALRMRFGRPDLILDELIKKVRAVPRINVEKLDTVLDLSIAVQQLCATMMASGMADHMNNPALLQELIEKLPGAQRLEWASYKFDHPQANLEQFDNWLCELADKASTVMSNTSLITRNQSSAANYDHKGKRQPDNKKEHVHAAHTEGNPPTKVDDAIALCSMCLKSNHRVQDCPIFLGKESCNRWGDVKKYNMCRKCLGKHYWKNCKSKQLCGVNGCPFRHHPLLHDPVKHAIDAKRDNENNQQQNVLCIHSPLAPKILFRVIPVVIYGLSSSIKTFAFLDEGSSRTLLDDDIAKQLNLKGPLEPLHLKWTGDITREESSSRRVAIQISGVGESNKRYRISNVRTVSKLNLVSQTLDKRSIETTYKHLKNVPLLSYENARPQILIGIEHWQLGMPLEIREGNWGEPIATKTKLGWTIFGVQAPNNHVDVQNVHYHTCDESAADKKLDASVKEFFSIESFGVKTPDNVLQSRDDQRAIAILEKNTKKVDGRYETGLLWRYDGVQFPDSYGMALKRLSCLESKMSKNPDLALNLQNQIKDYVIKGYARRMTDDELQRKNPRKWYLPIFAVSNPNKPSKIRLVWDAAAKVNGVSLNSMLLKGPDLLCSLPEILYRFRERLVAIAGDITEMYHQVSIIRDDQDSQRFLWRDSPSEKPSVYAMNVMTFGASCSPCAAHYVKNINAEKFINECPRAVEAICNNHYVDDWLDCFDTEKEAIRVAHEVIKIHEEAGFVIQKWVSNSENVLQCLGVGKDVGKTIDLNINNETVGAKVLGMWWDPKNDNFFYNFDASRINSEILTGVRQPSKREVLRTLMMIYDPLGLIAPFLVYVKILLQDIWRSKIDWDQTIDDSQSAKWMKWTELIPKIQDVKIPRCYFGKDYQSLELHVFVDASDSAYAAVAYFRFVYEDNKSRCSLVAGKSKVAPINPPVMSVPRLELQAAVLGARLSNSIVVGHTLKPDRVVFWTDATDVLCWIRSDLRKYRQFVAFRVSEILETTKAIDWRWVPSQHNPADDATKWKVQSKFCSNSRWFLGPEFLNHPESDWPIEERKNQKNDECDQNLEMKPHMPHIEPESTFLDRVIDRCSTWRKAYRVTAWILRCVENFKSKSSNKEKILGSLEIKRAKAALYRIAQGQTYPEEISLLKKNPEKSVEKSSTLYKLSPCLDNHEVLRMRGRTRRCEVATFDAINPIILPRHHRLTKLIVAHYHTKYLHANHETVVNEIRQLYVIPRLRVVLNHICSTCQTCKNRRAVPKPPEMSDLPKARLAAFNRPFSYVGIDFFGPLEVTVGRRVEKRWGCLFTCLTVRAIHIEVAHSLSKASFMMCLRKFISRRGMPIEIRTDNGTNFIGVRNELRKIVHAIPLDEIKTSFEEINWVLNPPAAPHMGGSWERLVRSVKNCLQSKMPFRRPDDENFYCYLVEVESMINSRPLTYLPVHAEEAEALTPNHFLVGSSGGGKPFSEFQDNVITMRRNYEHSQQMSLHFWKRWLREYLPELTRRSKWYEKVDPIKQGDLVVIMDESKRSSWSKGIVVETMCGKNADQVRQVRVKTANGVYVRPASKVAVLDIEPDSKIQTS